MWCDNIKRSYHYSRDRSSEIFFLWIKSNPSNATPIFAYSLSNLRQQSEYTETFHSQFSLFNYLFHKPTGKYIQYYLFTSIIISSVLHEKRRSWASIIESPSRIRDKWLDTHTRCLFTFDRSWLFITKVTTTFFPMQCITFEFLNKRNVINNFDCYVLILWVLHVDDIPF